MRHLPQYILAILIVILIFLVGFTYYIQKAVPSFQRLVVNPIPTLVQELKIERYDTKHHPVLFKIKATNNKKLLDELKIKCNLNKITTNKVPTFIDNIDANLTKAIRSSNHILMSKDYNLTEPKEGRFYLLFEKENQLFLFTNENF